MICFHIDTLDTAAAYSPKEIRFIFLIIPSGLVLHLSSMSDPETTKPDSGDPVSFYRGIPVGIGQSSCSKGYGVFWWSSINSLHDKT